MVIGTVPVSVPVAVRARHVVHAARRHGGYVAGQPRLWRQACLVSLRLALGSNGHGRVHLLGRGLEGLGGAALGEDVDAEVAARSATRRSVRAARRRPGGSPSPGRGRCRRRQCLSRSRSRSGSLPPAACPTMHPRQCLTSQRAAPSKRSLVGSRRRSRRGRLSSRRHAHRAGLAHHIRGRHRQELRGFVTLETRVAVVQRTS